MDPVMVEMYELKLKDLLDKLERAKEKQRALQVENETLLKAQTKSVSEKQDIVEFLRIELANHEHALADTEDRLHELEKDKLAQQRQHTDELEQNSHRAVEDRESLQQKLTKVSADLADLSEFRGRKDAMERDLSRLMEELSAKERSLRIETTALERKFLQDKHILKREMSSKVTDAVASFKRVADNQMAETTKRAIRENLVATAQLRKLGAKAELLLVENEQLKSANTKLRIDADILREGQSELAKRNSGAYHLVRRLLAKLEAHKVPFDRDDRKALRTTLPASDFGDLRGVLDALSSTNANSNPSGPPPFLPGGGGDVAALGAAGAYHFAAASGNNNSNNNKANEPAEAAAAAAAVQLANLRRAETAADLLMSALTVLASELSVQVYRPSSPSRSPSKPRRRLANDAQQVYAVPPVVRRFLHDLQARRVSVEVQTPDAGSRPTSFGSAVKRPHRRAASDSNSANTDKSGRGVEDFDAMARMHLISINAAQSTRKAAANLDVLLPHLPQLPGHGLIVP
ncbi:hypothetical protein BC828DRAFT_380186 [Blastocladiella britannica]|nr:hypothetical protein BC828DRAFT_380186 [Blastocladiella britannica]